MVKEIRVPSIGISGGVPASASGLARADTGDMFIGIVGQKTGPIKGESRDDKHKDEIDVLSWSWGIKTHIDMATGGASGKATIKELRVLKHTDAASTALMLAAVNNEVIKKAVLSVRKAGTTQQEYFKLTIEKGRITSYDVQAPESETSAQMLESVTLSFQKIEIEYRQQGADGQLKGSSVFMHDIL
ncbi:MAG: type VI secretion system tube protein Hcp [Chromatiales bacterium]|nr:type VI secretion system tube protein Hcp [Chromatiales bacterium]